MKSEIGGRGTTARNRRDQGINTPCSEGIRQKKGATFLIVSLIVSPLNTHLLTKVGYFDPLLAWNFLDSHTPHGGT